MAKLTLTQIRDYVRSITGVMDSDIINTVTLNEDINLAQRKIQVDLLELGIKQFTKYKVSEGAFVIVPTDMIFHPNAIIDIEASDGTKATVNLADIFIGGQNIQITSLEPGSVWNNFEISLFNSGTTPEPSVLSYTVGLDPAVNIQIGALATPTTVTKLLNLFATHQLLKNLFTIINAAPLTDTLVLLSGPGTGANVLLSNGTGNSWRPVEERSIERFNRIKNSSFQAGTALEPVYRRLGDNTANQTLEFFPRTILLNKIYYYYLLPDLVADTDISGLPTELEELLLIDAQRRIYIYMKERTKMMEQIQDYETKIASLSKRYQDSLLTSMQDKQRNETMELTA